METIATRQAWDLRLELLPERYQGKNSVIRTDTDVINQPRIARDSQQLKTAPIARNARVSTAINRRTRRLISAKLVDESAVDPGFIVSREAAQRAVDTHGFVGCVVFLLAIIQLKSLPARGPVLAVLPHLNVLPIASRRFLLSRGSAVWRRRHQKLRVRRAPAATITPVRSRHSL